MGSSLFLGLACPPRPSRPLPASAVAGSLTNTIKCQTLVTTRGDAERPGSVKWCREPVGPTLPVQMALCLDISGLNMHKTVKWLMGVSVCALLMACGGDKTTGKACLGANNDSLVEGMQDKCKAGDTVATKHPAYFCDFNYAVAYNSYNSAICVYSGALKPERTTEKS